MNTEVSSKQFERIQKCKADYLNISLCKNMRGERDKKCFNYQSILDRCVRAL